MGQFTSLCATKIQISSYVADHPGGIGKKIIHSPFFFSLKWLRPNGVGLQDWGFTVGEVLQAFLKITFHLRSRFEYLDLFWSYLTSSISNSLLFIFKLYFGFRKHILLICLYYSPATDRFQEFGALHHLFLPPLKPVVSSVLFCISKTGQLKVPKLSLSMNMERSRGKKFRAGKYALSTRFPHFDELAHVT